MFIYRVNEEQYSYLCGLNIQYVIGIMRILTNWIESGIYDFFDLPYSMKVELHEPRVLGDEICTEIQKREEGMHPPIVQ